MELELDIQFIAGGKTLCGSWWTMKAAAIDLCFKVYYVVGGSASINFEQGCCVFEPGRLYFLNGYKFKSQICKDFMDVYWVHFNPKGINPRVLSSIMPSWQSRPANEIDAASFQIGIENAYGEKSEPLTAVSGVCRISATVEKMLAELLEQCSETEFRNWSASLRRVQPALDYMDARYAENPSLEKLAEIASLTPNYFHRAFKKIFGITPFEYMLKKRLDKAKRLLTSTMLSVAEIAEAAGYENSYYFSRMFKKHTGRTPTQIRKNSPV